MYVIGAARSCPDLTAAPTSDALNLFGFASLLEWSWLLNGVNVIGAARFPSFIMASAIPVDLSLTPPLAQAGFSQSPSSSLSLMSVVMSMIVLVFVLMWNVDENDFLSKKIVLVDVGKDPWTSIMRDCVCGFFLSNINCPSQHYRTTGRPSVPGLAFELSLE